MPPAVTASFRTWLKSSNNMKLNSDAAVTRITYEGITNYDSLQDFDKSSIESLPKTCINTIPAIPEDLAAGIAAEPEVVGANISTISVRRLIVASNAANYYKSIGRTMASANMHYGNILSNFKVEWESYQDLKTKDEPTPPTINDRDNDRKIIKWAPIFHDCLGKMYGAHGPLAYILREDEAVPSEVDDPLGTDDTTNQINSHFGASGSLHNELIARLPHTGAIFKHDNSTVFSLIEKAARNTSIESTVKPLLGLRMAAAPTLPLSQIMQVKLNTAQYTKSA